MAVQNYFAIILQLNEMLLWCMNVSVEFLYLLNFKKGIHFYRFFSVTLHLVHVNVRKLRKTIYGHVDELEMNIVRYITSLLNHQRTHLSRKIMIYTYYHIYFKTQLLTHGCKM